MSGSGPAMPGQVRQPGRHSRELLAGGLAGGLLLILIPVGAAALLQIRSLNIPEWQWIARAAIAAAGPALYFAITARRCEGPIGTHAVLAVLSKFTATLIAAAGLCALALAGFFAILLAAPAFIAAAVIAAGTVALTRGHLLGVLPVLAVLLLSAATCFGTQFSDPADTGVLQISGVLAVTLACAVGAVTGRALRRSPNRAGTDN